MSEPEKGPRSPIQTEPMRFIPNAAEDVREMLQVIGVDSVERLFDSIPASVRLNHLLELPAPWSELEVRRFFRSLATKNHTGWTQLSFLGAGCYAHYQPACIDPMIQRAEFLTAYTPYQPEVSQGTLQAIFEYQTHQCMLTGLDVANASLYDGSTAFCEGVLLAERVAKKRNRVAVARSVHPEYRATLETYVQNLGVEIDEIGWGPDGRIDLEELKAKTTGETFAVAIQSPNFLGVIEDYDAISAIGNAAGATCVATIAEATSLGILTPPGEHGFDIAVGEGQAWGIPPQFGGPYVGFMVVRDPLKRHMPGRLVGETVDVDGERAYVLTLATREQHIRREKATSNICTNQALFALAANMYLSLMGKKGLREVATQCLQRAAYLKSRLVATGAVTFPFTGPVYNEFVVRTERPARTVLTELESQGILGGVTLDRWFPDRTRDLLVAVTELHGHADLDRFAAALATASTGGAR